jgi:ABC-type amino acid transport substrate-binding protein
MVKPSFHGRQVLDKRAFIQAIGSAVIAAPVALLTTKLDHQDKTGPAKETAFDRIIRTNTLRCGYGIWRPGMNKDPVTGKLSGIFFDYVEAIGQHTGLKIEWTEEVGWGDFPAALNAGRIDAMCFGAWPKATTAKEVLFTEPTYFLPINAYTRIGDTRFDQAIDKVNSEEIIISTMDAELSSQLAASRFPKARTLSVPQLSDASTLLLNVTSRKADITFTDAWTAAEYMSKNPGQLQLVKMEKPLRLFGHTIPVAKGETSLIALLNAATEEIMTSGEFDKIMKKYSAIPGVLLMQDREYK